MNQEIFDRFCTILQNFYTRQELELKLPPMAWAQALDIKNPPYEEAIDDIESTVGNIYQWFTKLKSNSLTLEAMKNELNKIIESASNVDDFALKLEILEQSLFDLNRELGSRQALSKRSASSPLDHESDRKRVKSAIMPEQSQSTQTSLLVSAGFIDPTTPITPNSQSHEFGLFSKAITFDRESDPEIQSTLPIFSRN